MQWQLSQTTVTAWPKERIVNVAPQLGQFRDLTCGVPGGAGPLELMTTPQSCVGSLTSGFQIQRPLPDTAPGFHRCNQSSRTSRCPTADQRRSRLICPNIERAALLPLRDNALWLLC